MTIMRMYIDSLNSLLQREKKIHLNNFLLSFFNFIILYLFLHCKLLFRAKPQNPNVLHIPFFYWAVTFILSIDNHHLCSSPQNNKLFQEKVLKNRVQLSRNQPVIAKFKVTLLSYYPSLPCALHPSTCTIPTAS